jgi:hypothetical protein
MELMDDIDEDVLQLHRLELYVYFDLNKEIEFFNLIIY